MKFVSRTVWASANALLEGSAPKSPRRRVRLWRPKPGLAFGKDGEVCDPGDLLEVRVEGQNTAARGLVRRRFGSFARETNGLFHQLRIDI